MRQEEIPRNRFSWKQGNMELMVCSVKSSGETQYKMNRDINEI